MPIAPRDLATVQKLVEEHRANSRWELPQLIEETSWLDRLKERLWDWFVSLFPNQKFETNFNFAHLFDIAILILKIFLILALITAVVWLVRALVAAHRKRQFPLPSHPAELASDIPVVWEEELSRALAEKNLAAAARVRWRIFLRRLALPISLTPTEFFEKRSPLTRDLSPFYELMFFHSPREERFADWSSFLEALERRT